MKSFVIIVLLCVSGTIRAIQTTPPPRVPGNRFIDPLAIERIWYQAKDCRRSTDPARTLNGKREVRECRKVIIVFGALSVKPSADPANSPTDAPSVAPVPPQSAYTGKTIIHYAPGRCKPLGDRRDSYVCGSSKDDPYEVWWYAEEPVTPQTTETK